MTELEKDIAALRNESEASLAETYGLLAVETPGGLAIRDAHGIVAMVQPECADRVRAGQKTLAHMLKCAAAIARENRRLLAVESQWKRIVAFMQQIHGVDATRIDA